MDLLFRKYRIQISCLLFICFCSCRASSNEEIIPEKESIVAKIWNANFQNLDYKDIKYNLDKIQVDSQLLIQKIDSNQIAFISYERIFNFNYKEFKLKKDSILKHDIPRMSYHIHAFTEEYKLKNSFDPEVLDLYLTENSLMWLTVGSSETGKFLAVCFDENSGKEVVHFSKSEFVESFHQGNRVDTTIFENVILAVQMNDLVLMNVYNKSSLKIE